MFIGEAKNPVAAAMREPAFSQIKEEKSVAKGDESINFDNILSESNSQKNIEFEKEKKAMGGDFQIGENKDEKSFREQLEKITGKKQDKLKNKLEKDDYLTLLVTQLKYQDPSKPMEQAEMAAQMAQLNTVEQLIGTNKILKEMSIAQNEGKVEKLAQYLGKNIEVQGNFLKISEFEKNASGRFDLPSTATTVNVEIKDAQMKTVRTITLGPKASGAHQFDWDGKLDNGQVAPSDTYTFSVNAASADGKPIIVKESYLTFVEGIGDILGGGKLETTSGKIDPAKVISIRNPKNTETQNSLVIPFQQPTKSPEKISIGQQTSAAKTQTEATPQAPLSQMPVSIKNNDQLSSSEYKLGEKTNAN